MMWREGVKCSFKITAARLLSDGLLSLKVCVCMCVCVCVLSSIEPDIMVSLIEHVQDTL